MYLFKHILKHNARIKCKWADLFIYKFDFDLILTIEANIFTTN